VFTGNTAASGGGAVYFVDGVNSTLTLEANDFVGNEAGKGGALLVDGENLDAQVHVVGSYFELNSTFGSSGGAILNEGDFVTLQISGSAFFSNTGFSGGAFLNIGDFVTTEIVGCQFDGNLASGGSGGAVYFATGQDSTLSVSGSSFSANSAGNTGGALVTLASPTTISGTTFVYNSSVNDGGAIWALSPTTMTNSTLSGNEAGRSGGAFYQGSGAATSFNNVTIVDNSADVSGGGSGNGGGLAFEAGPNLSLQNSIIALNSDPGGQAPDCATADSPVSNGNNFIGRADGCNWSAAAGDQVGTSAAPLDPLLAPLGGAPLVHVPLSGSPVIDFGRAFCSV
jgi:predicted outer membrane repeat protein